MASKNSYTLPAEEAKKNPLRDEITYHGNGWVSIKASNTSLDKTTRSNNSINLYLDDPKTIRIEGQEPMIVSLEEVGYSGATVVRINNKPGTTDDLKITSKSGRTINISELLYDLQCTAGPDKRAFLTESQSAWIGEKLGQRLKELSGTSVAVTQKPVGPPQK